MKDDQMERLRHNARQLLNKTAGNQALLLHSMRVCLLHDIAVALSRIDCTLELIELHLQNSPNVSAVVGDRPTGHNSKQETDSGVLLSRLLPEGGSFKQGEGK